MTAAQDPEAPLQNPPCDIEQRHQRRANAAFRDRPFSVIKVKSIGAEHKPVCNLRVYGFPCCQALSCMRALQEMHPHASTSLCEATFQQGCNIAAKGHIGAARHAQVLAGSAAAAALSAVRLRCMAQLRSSSVRHQALAGELTSTHCECTLGELSACFTGSLVSSDAGR